MKHIGLAARAALLLLCVVFGVAAQSPPAAGQQSLNADVQRLGPTEYRIRIVFPGAVTPDQAQAMLAEVGAHLCSGTTPAWGRYEFETTEPASSATEGQASTRFEQDLSCGAAGTTAKPGTPAPKTPASDADRRAVESRTRDYLAAKDRADFDAADAMFEPDVLSQLDRVTWHDKRRAFNAEAGQPAKREIVGVTFYDDPPGAARLGRHAAVDYRATFDDRAFYCGYVIWVRQADGGWRLTREDEAIVTDEEARSLPEDQLAKLKQQPGCRASQ